MSSLLEYTDKTEQKQRRRNFSKHGWYDTVFVVYDDHICHIDWFIKLMKSFIFCFSSNVAFVVKLAMFGVAAYFLRKYRGSIKNINPFEKMVSQYINNDYLCPLQPKAQVSHSA